MTPTNPLQVRYFAVSGSALWWREALGKSHERFVPVSYPSLAGIHPHTERLR